MKPASLAFAAALIATAAAAQTTTNPARTATPGNSAPGATSNAPMPGVNPSTGTTPSTGLVDRNSGTAAASGDRNQAVATTDANAPQPARGANSFSMGEARARLQRGGFQNVSGLHKDNGGVWRGTASRNGQQVSVWLDYKGNMGQQGGTPASATGANATTPR